MSEEFLAQKGAAAPAATHPGGAARFHARRTIMLPAINLPAPAAQTETPTIRGTVYLPRAARLTGVATAEKRKFTFRIDPVRHAAFCRAAEARSISRQRLLTQALDELLERLGQQTDQKESGGTWTPRSKYPSSNSAASPPGCTAALPPSL